MLKGIDVFGSGRVLFDGFGGTLAGAMAKTPYER
jgi:hypothetical protein